MEKLIINVTIDTIKTETQCFLLSSRFVLIRDNAFIYYELYYMEKMIDRYDVL